MSQHVCTSTVVTETKSHPLVHSDIAGIFARSSDWIVASLVAAAAPMLFVSSVCVRHSDRRVQLLWAVMSFRQVHRDSSLCHLAGSFESWVWVCVCAWLLEHMCLKQLCVVTVKTQFQQTEYVLRIMYCVWMNWELKFLWLSSPIVRVLATFGLDKIMLYVLIMDMFMV